MVIIIKRIRGLPMRKKLYASTIILVFLISMIPAQFTLANTDALIRVITPDHYRINLKSLGYDINIRYKNSSLVGPTIELEKGDFYDTVQLTSLYSDGKYLRYLKSEVDGALGSTDVSKDNLTYLGTIVKTVNGKSNKYYSADLEKLKSEGRKQIKVIQQKEAKQIEVEAKRKKALEDEYKKTKIPLKVVRTEVSFNSIGIPEGNVTIQNLTKKTIDAYEVDIYCINGYGKPVYHYYYDTNKFEGISQRNSLKFGDSQSDTWTLYGHENTTKIRAVIVSVHFTDGTVWKKK
jgi:hypothetical protein